MTRLPTFLCNDVVKNPQVEKYLADYQYTEKVFGWENLSYITKQSYSLKDWNGLHP